MNSNKTAIIRTVPAAGDLHKVPGFDPLKHLQRVPNGNGNQVLQLGLPYKRLWFRLACPSGRLLLNPLRVTDQMAIFEAQVFFQKEDPTPVSSFTSTKTVQEARAYIRAAQDEALSIALDNAGFGIQLCDVAQDADCGRTAIETPAAEAGATVQAQPQRMSPAAVPVVEVMKQPVPDQKTAGSTELPGKAQPAEIVDTIASVQSQEVMAKSAPAAQQSQEEIPSADAAPTHIKGPAKEVASTQQQAADTATEAGRMESRPQESPKLRQEPANQAAQTGSPVTVLNFLAQQSETGDIPASAGEEAAPVELEATNTSPTYTEDMSVEEITARMTMEEARNMVVCSGPNKGWTLEQVVERRPASLKFFTTPFCEASNIFKAAATLMLQEVNQKKAG